MEESINSFWKKCSSCKEPIGFGDAYYVCSVSTCNGLRTGYVFCTMNCFERHLPGARHRDAGAVEKEAPMTAAGAGEVAGASRSAESTAPSSAGQARSAEERSRIIVRPGTAVQNLSKPNLPNEVLIIASRLKEYIQAKSEYNTSASVMDVLSDHVRRLCDEAIDNARAEGRRTVMDRDFKI